MIKNLLVLNFCVVFLLSTFNSCDIESFEELTSIEKVSKSGPVIEENTQIQIKVGDVFENVNNLVGNPDLKSGLFGDGPLVIKDSNTFTLDYSNLNGYEGIITVAFSGIPLYSTPNLKARVTCVDYTDNGLVINGIVDFEVVSSDQDGLDIFVFSSLDDLKLKEDGTSFIWSFNYTITHDKTISSDVLLLLLKGSSTQEKDGITNEINISEDLYHGTSCDYPKFGVVNYILNKNSDDEFEVIVDYGVDSNGDSKDECDSYAEISSGSFSTVINLN